MVMVTVLVTAAVTWPVSWFQYWDLFSLLCHGCTVCWAACLVMSVLHRVRVTSFKKFHPNYIRRFVITEKAPTRAFSWLKAATTAFTFKTLLRHYAKRALTPRSLNVKLGPRRNYHKGRAAIRHYANQPAVPYDLCVADPISR